MYGGGAMRGVRGGAAVCAVPVLLAALLTGCQGLSETPKESPSTSAGGEPAGASLPGGHGAVFLDVDECSSFGRTSFTEVPCASERAAARVVARHDGTVRDGPPCPGTTDFVLHISAQNRASDEDGDGAVPQGYACMRNLTPPHPGDPGGGGGPRTIVGDCVYGSGDGQVRETACDGEGGHEPGYRVTRIVDRRSQCPASTALYVDVGGEKPVGCARRL